MANNFRSDEAIKSKSIPHLNKSAVRIYALGGISEVGRNMTVFEYQDSILIVDCGVLFPDNEQPGVDLILPDFRYLQDKVKKITAIVVTHGHEDHIGAIPFLLKLRSDIPIISSKFSLALIKAKCDEHKLRPKLIEVRENESRDIGSFKCEFLSVNHSIPDALAVFIKAGENTILHTGDIKLDQLPMDGRLTDLGGFSRIGNEGVDLFLVDSTNAEVPGFVMSEKEIGPVLDQVIGKARQRVLVASFASHVHRIQQVIDVAVANNRKIAFVGRSMVRNMGIAKDLGYLTIPDNVLVSLDEAATLPDYKQVLITTGSQGEPLSALARMANSEHRQVNVRNGDLVVLASSLIPGNESSVFTVVNRLVKQGVNVITQQNAKVHVSGHASAGELLYLYNAVKPKNVMPVHGEWRHLRANAALAQATGVNPENIVLAENGVVVDLFEHKAKIVGSFRVGNVYVDGLSVGDVGESTLSDRLILGEGGFIAINFAVVKGTARVLGKIEINGRGFSDDPGILYELQSKVSQSLKDMEDESKVDSHHLAQHIRRLVGKWVNENYRRRPMIVPNVISIPQD